MKRVICTLLFCAVAVSAYAHCEIPCGIYDDQARIDLLAEHITTIETSMKQIMALAAEEDPDPNQMVRWIMNKEDHANKIQEVVTQYFMTQRVNPVSASYIDQVTVLHQMLIAAMKTKQSTDLSQVMKLRELLGAFTQVYFGTKTNQ